ELAHDVVQQFITLTDSIPFYSFGTHRTNQEDNASNV
ncbi:unnamed protein product, partial [Tilletia controversa]